MIKLEPSFIKGQFDKLIWPTARFTATTGLWCTFLIALLGTSLVYVFDPLAIKLVMFLSGS